MARKKVIDLDCDQTIAFEKVGQMVEGFYIGSKKITTDYGDSKLHVFKGEDGSFGVYGSAKLDEKLGNVPAGYLTFITYGGKVKIPGGKTMKRFEVEYDDEEFVDVGNTTVNFTNSKSEEPEAEESEPAAEEEESNEEPADVDDEAIETAEVEEDEEPKNPVKKPLTKAKPAAAANVINAEKKKSVESLLSKTKR